MSKFDLLYEQDFLNTDTVTLTHNLNRRVFNVRCVVTDTALESESLRQIVKDIELTETDPLNELTVILTEIRSGKIQLIAEDTIQSPYYTVEEKIASQQQTVLAGTAPVKFEYGGNANTGRVLVYALGDASNVTPYVVISEGFLRGISFQSGASNTGTISVYKIGTPDVLVYQFVVTNSDKESFTNLSVPLSQEDELYVKVDSGSFNKPVVVLYTQTI